MLVRRPPSVALRPFVTTLWVSESGPQPHARELVLPTGAMHVVFRLADPLRLFRGAEDREGELVAHAVVGGARAAPYLRDVSGPALSVGAQLAPGAGARLLGLPAHELAGRHTALAELWGDEAERMRARLAEADGPEAQLALLEAALYARLAATEPTHPVVAHAVQRLAEGCEVAEVVRASGFSHKHFVALFHRAVGLTPKRFARVARLQRTLREAATAGTGSWAALAAVAGYSDQAHLTRDFRALTGLTPAAYARRAPELGNHVPLLPEREGHR